MEDNINLFWHICGINDWKNVVEDQYLTIESSGLIDRSENVLVTFLGKDRKNIEWLEKRNKKIIVNNYSQDFTHYERMCLNGLRDWSAKNDGLVLYLHAKGVSRVNNKNVWGWRKMLEFFVVENHEKCINHVKEYDLDTLGGNLCVLGKLEDINKPGHGMHYSGNFWWSRADYLRKLPKIPENIKMQENGNYIRYCEFWLLKPHPDVKCGVLFKTKIPHYYGSQPESDYKTNAWIQVQNLPPHSAAS